MIEASACLHLLGEARVYIMDYFLTSNVTFGPWKSKSIYYRLLLDH